MQKRDPSLAPRPLTRQDLDDVSALYARVFRSRETDKAGSAISSYLNEVFLDLRTYGEEDGSFLCRGRDGEIAAAILALPMSIRCMDETVTARLLCCLMKNPQSSEANVGALRLCLTLHPRTQDFCFTDTAAPRSIDFVRSGGGEMLPFQTLNWRRVFRPLSFIVTRRITSGWLAPVVTQIAAAGDAILRRMIAGLIASPNPGVTPKSIGTEEFRAIAERLTSRYAIRPAWDPEEFAWLVKSALTNPRLGDMHVRSLIDRSGKVIGAYLYFLDACRVARVFHVMHEKEHAEEVMQCLFDELDRAGVRSATGIAQADLLLPLSREPRVSYRFRGGFCVLSKHAHVIDALRRNDVYLGGFYSEAWNRLAMDFR